MTTSAINQALAARADAARARLRAQAPELGTNPLTLAEVVALDEDRLAELVAVDHFGWRMVNDCPQIFECKPTNPGVAFMTRPYRPCTSADDDQLALRFIRTKHAPLLGLFATALLDLAAARAAGRGAPLDPLMVTVVYRKGDHCRALLLTASTAWRTEQLAAQKAQRRAIAESQTTHHHKETRHEELTTPTPTTSSATRTSNPEPSRSTPDVLTTSPTSPPICAAAPANPGAAGSDLGEHRTVKAAAVEALDRASRDLARVPEAHEGELVAFRPKFDRERVDETTTRLLPGGAVNAAATARAAAAAGLPPNHAVPLTAWSGGAP